MIRRLKTRFTLLAMTAICVLLTVVVAGMNLINYTTVVSEADSTLELLSMNRGSFPDMKNDHMGPFPRPMSPELPYESRYFSVVLTKTGKVVLTDTGKIASVDSGTAAQYGVRAYESGKQAGFIGEFRYLRGSENNDVRIVFLDCGRKLDSFRSFLYASIGMTLAGLLAGFLFVFFYSGRIIRPIAESYEKQRRFITDAGHEIKTPLTIINANVDVLEMELEGSTESLEDIRQQTRRLTRLTNDLVSLARMEESEQQRQMIDFPLSEVVEDAIAPFRTPAQSQQKTLHATVQPMLTLRGDAKAITQLVTLLMDNALKYTPAGGNIGLDLRKTGKSVCLTVYNTTAAPVTGEVLNHAFDRFYRADASRNSETGGHGIGLSIAQAIVTAHNGKIQATATETAFQITTTLPVA